MSIKYIGFKHITCLSDGYGAVVEFLLFSLAVVVSARYTRQAEVPHAALDANDTRCFRRSLNGNEFPVRMADATAVSNFSKVHHIWLTPLQVPRDIILSGDAYASSLMSHNRSLQL